MSESSGSGFGKFVPGFEFLQNLAGQAAGGVAQGIGNSLPQMPNLGSWVAPTFNVEDLEKRIEELKAVHFWLDQNSKALGATIQALEVQKMTLATLKNMNFSLGDVANALKIKAADAVASFTGGTPAPAAAPTQFAGLEIPPRTYGTTAEPEPEPEPELEDDEEEEAPEAAPAPAPRKASARKAAEPAPAGGVVDPMQWWGALSQQFQNIATTAMKDVAKQSALDTTRHVATGLTEQAVKTATDMAGKAAGTVARNVGNAVGMGKAAARAVTSRPAPARKAAPRPAAKKPAAKKTAAKKARPQPVAAPARAATVQPLSTGDWPLPTAFFPGFQPVVASPAPRAAAKSAVKKAPAKKPASGGPRRR